jgi:hypothetical protein
MAEWQERITINPAVCQVQCDQDSPFGSKPDRYRRILRHGYTPFREFEADTVADDSGTRDSRCGPSASRRQAAGGSWIT